MCPVTSVRHNDLNTSSLFVKCFHLQYAHCVIMSVLLITCSMGQSVSKSDLIYCRPLLIQCESHLFSLINAPDLITDVVIYFDTPHLR